MRLQWVFCNLSGPELERARLLLTLSDSISFAPAERRLLCSLRKAVAARVYHTTTLLYAIVY